MGVIHRMAPEKVRGVTKLKRKPETAKVDWFTCERVEFVKQAGGAYVKLTVKPDTWGDGARFTRFVRVPDGLRNEADRQEWANMLASFGVLHRAQFRWWRPTTWRGLTVTEKLFLHHRGVAVFSERKLVSFLGRPTLWSRLSDLGNRVANFLRSLFNRSS